MNYRNLFELYETKEKNHIRGIHFNLILESLGLLGEFPNEVDPDSLITWNEFINFLNKFSEHFEKEDTTLESIFNEYANEDGYINIENLRLMFNNHIEGLTSEEIENLVKDSMKEEILINFNNIKNLNIF